VSSILIGKCEQVLIGECSSLIVDGFPVLLDSNRDEDIQRMYSLLTRIPEGVELLRKKSEEYVWNTGRAAISKLVGEAGSGIESLDPKIYVDYLLEEIVTRIFGGDGRLVESLDKACRRQIVA